jgi:protein tyrosine kinase modulator
MDDLEDFEQPSGAGGGLANLVADPVGILRRRWFPMLVTFAVASVVGTLGVLFVPIPYEATARLLISGQSIREDFVRTTIAEGVFDQLNAMVGEVLSRDSLTSIAHDHQLASGSAGERNVLGKLAKSITVTPDPSVQMSNNPGALIFLVKAKWSNPTQASDVANDVVGRLIEVNLDRRSRQARMATDFLRRELERAEATLKEQSAKVAEFKEQHRGELPSELPAKNARLERLQAQRASIALQISEAESRLVTLQTQGGEGDPRSAALQQLEQQLLHEKTVNTEEHPNVIALERQVEMLRAQMAKEPLGTGYSPTQRAVVEGVRREIDGLRNQAAMLERDMAELEVQVSHTPAREETLGQLEERERVLRENYAATLRKVKDAELAESLELAQQGIQVSRLEAAAPPREPKIPTWKLAGGAALGVLGLTAAMGLLLELRDPVIVAADELETLTGMGLLGTIPRAG